MPRPTLRRAASAGGASDKMHSIGGHVIKIISAQTIDSDGYVNIRYAVQEPDGTFREYEWTNEFRSYFVTNWDGATPFEKLLTAMEECNPGFDMERWGHTWNERELVGKIVGIVFREYHYPGNDGADRSRPEVCYPCSVKTIEGGVKVPKPRYKKGYEPAAEPAAAEPAAVEADVYDIDIPF